MLALTMGEFSIVGHAGEWTCLIGAMGGFEPPPVSCLVHRYTEPQPPIPRRLGPGADDIAVRPDSSSVPWMMF